MTPSKNGEDVMFNDSDIPNVVTLHIKKIFRSNKCQFTGYNGSIYTVLRKLSGGGIGPVSSASLRVQKDNGIGTFFRRIFHFVKPLLY